LINLFKLGFSNLTVVRTRSEYPTAETDIDDLLLQGRVLRWAEVRPPYSSHLGPLEPATQARNPFLRDDYIIICEHHQLGFGCGNCDIARIGTRPATLIIDKSNASGFGLIPTRVIGRTYNHHL